MRFVVVALVLTLQIIAASLLNCTGVFAQGISLKSNESVELGAVYWVRACKSILKSFGGVDVLEGSPEVTVSLKEGPVYARRQNCPKPVNGATVILSAKEIKNKETLKFTYRVKYKTLDGDRQSTFSFDLLLFP